MQRRDERVKAGLEPVDVGDRCPLLRTEGGRGATRPGQRVGDVAGDHEIDPAEVHGIIGGHPVNAMQVVGGRSEALSVVVNKKV